MWDLTSYALGPDIEQLPPPCEHQWEAHLAEVTKINAISGSSNKTFVHSSVFLCSGLRGLQLCDHNVDGLSSAVMECNRRVLWHFRTGQCVGRLLPDHGVSLRKYKLIEIVSDFVMIE